MTINQVTPAKFAALKSKLIATHQAEVSGEASGAITGHGVNANYSYDAAAQTLSVDVVHHPFFIPVGKIESSLQDALASA